MTPKVIDLSHHNTVPGDFAEFKSQGILGVIHKATEGLVFTDPKLKARHWLTRQAGLAWGVYHFLRPGDISSQIAFFLTQTNFYRDSRTLIALDYEDAAVSLLELKQALRSVQGLTKCWPVIYSGDTLKTKLNGKPDPDLSNHRLWLADYGEAYSLPPGWDSFWLRQYTDKGTIVGVTGPVDLNEIAMSDADFLADWTGVPLGPSDRYLPPQPATITVTVPKGTKVVVQEV